MTRLPEAREPLWDAFKYCSKTNPAALRFIISMMSIYLHVGPFSRKVMAAIDRQIHNGDGARTPEYACSDAARARVAFGLIRPPCIPGSLALLAPRNDQALAAAANPIHRLNLRRFAGHLRCGRFFWRCWLSSA